LLRQLPVKHQRYQEPLPLQPEITERSSASVEPGRFS